MQPDTASPPQDVPAAPAAPNEPQQPVTPDYPPEQAPQEPAPSQGEPDGVTPAPEQIAEADDDYDYPNYDIPESSPINFDQLPVDENNLIDVNALAGTINQSIAAAEERAAARANRSFQEQRAEEKAWEKAFTKYPELKNNRELRDLVQNARIGEITNLFNKATDATALQQIKLPSPGIMADRLFKHMGTAKAEGIKQANENTVVQQSAHIETSGRRNDDSGDARNKAFQNINNSNKEVARKARQDLLKSYLWQE